jgi:WD40 repeat protein
MAATPFSSMPELDSEVKGVDISPDGSICAALSSEGTVSLWDVRGGTYIVPTLSHRAAAMQLLPANVLTASSAAAVATSTAAPMLVLATLDDPSPKIELYDLRYMGRQAIDGGQVSMAAVSCLHSDGLSWFAGTTDGLCRRNPIECHEQKLFHGKLRWLRSILQLLSSA